MLAGVGAQAALAIAERQGEALQARFAARRDNQAEAARLREAAGRITDVEALLKDRRTLRLVLEAFQLETEVDKRATLRRVLTEDPAAQGSLVNRLSDPRWKALADAFASSRAVTLSAEALGRQAPEEVAKLELNRIAGLDFLQVQALTAEQIAALDPAQIGAISAEAIGGMETGDVAALSRAQVAALTPAQLRGLLQWQVAAIEPEDISALSPEQLRAFSPAQLTALTPAQMAALADDQVGAFSANQAAAFDPTQRAALSAAGRAMLDTAPFLPDEAPLETRRAPLADSRLVDRVIAGAMTNRFEKAMGDANPGLREALYFRRMAGQVTSIAQLMSDRALTEVVRGALGIPTSFGTLEFEQQRDLLTRRLDVAKLQDPKEVAKMAARYVAQLQPAPAASPVLSLLGGGGPGLESLVGRRVSFSA
ncbi:DUF1217 domain-containing protein [Falsiroseomonas oryzae]|uniref:DUF1217 domain-containing protein n=1 Tax=Falsiroseomonas oryzae TaxID=2766473 RepID=UPI0022EABF5C|nr:DUF1217 domain-containing protein [Roseomonas sp. MO-31]